jgi:hypothetical protein
LVCLAVKNVGKFYGQGIYFGIVYGHLVIKWEFCIVFHVLVYFINKNLAILLQIHSLRPPEHISTRTSVILIQFATYLHTYVHWSASSGVSLTNEVCLVRQSLFRIQKLAELSIHWFIVNRWLGLPNGFFEMHLKYIHIQSFFVFI